MKKIKVNGKIVGKKYGTVIPLGKKDDFDNTCIESPSVIFDGKLYHMWYAGYNGKKWNIHYATSEDGISWDKRGPVSILGVNGVLNDYYEYDPSVIYDGTTFHMWYVGFNGVSTGIHYATSNDGLNWKKLGDVLETGNINETDYVRVHTPSVIFDGTTYHMWYTGSDAKNNRIHYATSEDGLNWTKHGVVIPLGNVGDSDDEHTREPFVIYDNNIFKMWYNGQNYSKDKLHFATSKDGKVWKKHSEQPPLLPKDDINSFNIVRPCIIKYRNLYKIWFNGYTNRKLTIHYTELLELV